MDDLFDDEMLDGLPDDVEFELIECERKSGLLDELRELHEEYELYHVDHSSRESHYRYDYGRNYDRTYSALVIYGEEEA